MKYLEKPRPGATPGSGLGICPLLVFTASSHLNLKSPYNCQEHRSVSCKLPGMTITRLSAAIILDFIDIRTLLVQ